MVLYGITLINLAEDLQASYPRLFTPFYTDNAEFYGSARKIAQLIKLILEQGMDQGYLPEPSKSLFISDFPAQEVSSIWEFKAVGLQIKFVLYIQYLGEFQGPREELG